MSTILSLLNLSYFVRQSNDDLDNYILVLLYANISRDANEDDYEDSHTVDEPSSFNPDYSADKILKSSQPQQGQDKSTALD